MRKLTLALSTAVLALSGAAVAQTPPPAPSRDRPPMTDMTRAQAQARAEAAFQRMDANRDGTVDQNDRQARKGQAFERMDTDRNGSISRVEFDAHSAQRAERKGDGPRMARHGGPGGKRAMMGAAAGPMTRQAFVDRALTIFDRSDANRDGTVTVSERKAARESMRGQWRERTAPRQQG
jgi:Ca2+-binding EF-hand superfamily protein